MQNRNIALKLNTIARDLREDKLKWVQGQLTVWTAEHRDDSDAHFGLNYVPAGGCMTGLIQQAFPAKDTDEYSYEENLRIQYEVFKQAAKLFDPEHYQDKGDTFTQIVKWNDEPGRTKDQIIHLFEQLAAEYAPAEYVECIKVAWKLRAEPHRWNQSGTLFKDGNGKVMTHEEVKEADNDPCSACALGYVSLMHMRGSISYRQSSTIHVRMELIANQCFIGFWNDDPNTTVGDVINLFENVAHSFLVT